MCYVRVIIFSSDWKRALMVGEHEQICAWARPQCGKHEARQKLQAEPMPWAMSFRVRRLKGGTHQHIDLIPFNGRFKAHNIALILGGNLIVRSQRNRHTGRKKHYELWRPLTPMNTPPPSSPSSVVQALSFHIGSSILSSKGVVCDLKPKITWFLART